MPAAFEIEHAFFESLQLVLGNDLSAVKHIGEKLRSFIFGLRGFLFPCLEDFSAEVFCLFGTHFPFVDHLLQRFFDLIFSDNGGTDSGEHSFFDEINHGLIIGRFDWNRNGKLFADFFMSRINFVRARPDSNALHREP